jgi:hypothetical protein
MAIAGSRGSGRLHILKTGGAESKTLTPVAGQKDTTEFDLRGLKVKVDGKWNYALGLVVYVDAAFTQTGAGTALNDDTLSKVLVSVDISCPILGTIYSEKHTFGALFRNIMTPVLCGYRERQYPETQLPISATNTRYLEYYFPFALESAEEPLDTAIQTALLEGGTIRVTTCGQTEFVPQATASTVNSIVIRCALDLAVDHRLWMPGAFGFKMQSDTGAVGEFRLKSLGQPTGMQHVIPGTGALAFAAQISDRLISTDCVGSDGPDNITKVHSVDLDIDNVRVVRLLYQRLYEAMGRGPLLGRTTVQTVGFPFEMAATTWNPPNSINALFLPLRNFANGQRKTRIKRFSAQQEVEISYDFTATPAGTMRHIYFEFFRRDVASLGQKMREVYGKELEGKVFLPKPASGKPLSPATLQAANYGWRYFAVSGARSA